MIPSHDQLKAAVNTILREKADSDPKNVYVLLKKQNPNWTLPETRVFKVVKKQQKKRAAMLSGSDEESAVSSVRQTARSLARFLGGKSRSVRGGKRGTATAPKESAPSKAPSSPSNLTVGTAVSSSSQQQQQHPYNILPPAVTEDTADMGVDDGGSPKSAELEAVSPASHMSTPVDLDEMIDVHETGGEGGTDNTLDDVYKDDNDGTKEINTGNLCEGCVIL